MIIESTRQSFPVVRTETGFDKACDTAYEYALGLFGVDDCGHLTKVPDSVRSTDTIVVQFDNYRHTGCMVGQEYVYTFTTWIERHEDEEEQP